MDSKGGLALGICVVIAAVVLSFGLRADTAPNDVGRYQFARGTK